MMSIERSFKQRNEELINELQYTREQVEQYKVEREKLKDQIFRLAELDKTKNRDIQALETKVDGFQKKLELALEGKKQQSSEEKKAVEAHDLSFLDRTLRAAHQECLNFLFVARSKELIEATQEVPTTMQRNLAREIGTMEYHLRKSVQDVEHYELLQKSGTMCSMIALLETISSLFPPLIPVLQCAIEMIQQDEKAMCTSQRSICMTNEASCQTNVEHLTPGASISQNRDSPKRDVYFEIGMLESKLFEFNERINCDINRARKAVYRLKQQSTNKTHDFIQQLSELAISANTIQQKSDSHNSLILLYQQLTNLYNQNLDLVKQVQTKGNQNLTDLKVRLEKGVKDQANFTSYIASITRRADDNSESFSEPNEMGMACKHRRLKHNVVGEQKEEEQLQVLEEDKNRHAALAMPEKYQRLWAKYRKQSARFRVLQQVLKEANLHQSTSRRTHRPQDVIKTTQETFKSPILLKPDVRLETNCKGKVIELTRKADELVFEGVKSSSTNTEPWSDLDVSLES